MTGHHADQSLIIVSNRGPAQFELDARGERTLTRGGGGLVTALSGLVANRDALWIASARRLWICWISSGLIWVGSMGVS